MKNKKLILIGCCFFLVLFLQFFYFGRIDKAYKNDVEYKKYLQHKKKNFDDNSQKQIQIHDLNNQGNGQVTPESTMVVKKKNGKYAFVLYATDRNYACATRVVIHQILKTSDHLDFDIIVYVPPKSSSYLVDYVKDINPSAMNPDFHGKYIVKSPDSIPTPHRGLYKYTMLKILPLGETEYDRLIYMDADALGPLKDITHLFNLPEVALASPVGYWENELCFTSLLLVYKPNKQIFEDVMSMVGKRSEGKYDADMDLLNNYFRPRTRGDFLIIHNQMVLLPLQYGTLTHSVRKSQHNNPDYVGTPKEAYERAFIVHFSDGGKPWTRSDREEYWGDVFNVWRSIAKEIC